MTAAQAVDKLMASEHADVIRESVRFMVAALMEAEVAALVGAEYGERAPERRMTQRNGYRERAGTRAWASSSSRSRGCGRARRTSRLSGAAPARRAGAGRGRPGGLRQRRLDAQGRPRRRAARGAHDQGPGSRLCARLDEQVAAFRERPLEGAYPYLWLDAKQEKVRDGAHVVSKALVIAYGVHETGRREVIGLDVGQIESEAFWREFLRSLKRRGLDGVRLCVSDAHEGLKNAIARVLGCPWQRCTVHFVRDMHQHCRPSQRALVSAALREVFNADGHDQARERVTP